MNFNEAYAHIRSLTRKDFVLKHSVGRINNEDIEQYVIHFLDGGGKFSSHFSNEDLDQVIQFVEQRISK